ncbi:MAG: ABC transporter permease [Acidobacteriota bacterium]|nr:ABC transporter permease [Acidobacteriota bacterium]
MPAIGSISRTFRSIGKLGIACVVVIALTVVVAILSPWLTPQDPNLGQIGEVYLGISTNHLLGTDGQGYDIFSRLMAGSRDSLLGPLAVAVMATAVATILATLAAWSRGLIDTGISAMTNVLFAFPGVILAILAATVLGASLTAAVFALTIAYIPAVTRVLRSAAVMVREQTYISALEIQGYSSVAICIRHLIPNMSALIVAEFTLLFGFSMVDLSAISYLGLGTQPPHSDWGVMVAEGQAGILAGQPGEALAAGITIFVIVLAFTLLGERIAGLGGADYRSTGSWLSMRSPRRRIAAIEAAAPGGSA